MITAPISHIARSSKNYHYSCVSLADRKARYVPWGIGFTWRTVTAAERPGVYLVSVAVCLGLSAMFLGLAFASSAAWVPVHTSSPVLD